MATHNTNVVFIDTSLDTHLALVVSDLDTVSDLKKSILSEHPLCFPKIGQILIHGIKVKRRGYFYHLSDSMLVRSAFSAGCSNKSWFLSVDAAVLGERAQNEHFVYHGSPNHVATLGIANNALVASHDPLCFPSKKVSTFDNSQLPQLENKLIENGELPVASPSVSEHTGKGAVENLGTGVKLSGNNDVANAFPPSVSETENHCILHEHPSLNIEGHVDGSGKGIKDNRTVCEENPLISAPSVKRKRKSKMKKEDTVQNDDSKDNASFVDDPLCFPSKKVSTFDNSQLPHLNIEGHVDGSGKGIEDNRTVCEENPLISAPSVKRKRKTMRKKEDTVQDDDSKGNAAFVDNPLSFPSKRDIDVVANPSELADKEVISKTEDLKEHQYTDCNNNNIKNDIDVAVSIKEASEPGLATNKKHKRMKRSLTVEAHEERKESEDLFEHKNEKSRDNDEYKDNKATEDILHTDPPAKKKKGKGKSGEKSLSEEKLFNDLNADNASIHVLEDKQKIQNSNAGQSAEHFNDTDLLKTSVRSKRRKGKMNSSNPPETPVVTSSRKEEEADHSGIQRGVQEEISEDGLFSKDISMSKTTIDNVETGTDACKESIHSTEKRTGNYKNHSDFEIKSQTSDVDEPMVLTKDKENAVLDQCHENEAGQIEGAEEGRVVSPQNGSELMLLDNSTLFNQDNTDANIGELNVTSKVVDVNEMTEPVKSEKEKKGMRKNKNSSGQPTPRKGISFTDAFASETVIMKSCSETNCDSMSGNKETEENPLNQTDGEKIKQEEMQGTSDNVDDFSAENACSLEQIKTKSNAEHMAKRQRKKSNNKQTSTSKSISNMLTDQVLDSKKPSESSGNGTPAKPPVAVTKKSMSTSTNFTNKSGKTNLEPAKDSVRREPSDSQFNVGSKDSDSRTDIETMARKNMHGLEATTRQTHAEDLSSSQKLSSKEELNVRIHPGKKVPNVHRIDRKDRVNASGKSMDLEKRRELFPVSNSKLKGSIKVVQNKAGKGSGNNVNGVVSKTHQKKSLLAGAIFNYDSSSSSEDEVDASTRTSTDNPLLSDSSDEDSSSGLDSPTGSYGGQSPENGGRSSLKASFSGTKGMSIDQLLRSSSRFKKAKTTASQLEESQSQPEFNPESLAE
uniref:Uncharacterized protein n=1 Tax=Cajanus cajan TaxID=3821 RepID=A0A151U8T9_CAJCA|nr:hypothetical protein KK1_019930 [Cajanus cajan]